MTLIHTAHGWYDTCDDCNGRGLFNPRPGGSGCHFCDGNAAWPATVASFDEAECMYQGRVVQVHGIDGVLYGIEADDTETVIPSIDCLSPVLECAA